MSFCTCQCAPTNWTPPPLPPIKAVRCKECKQIAKRCYRCAHFVCPDRHIVVEHSASNPHLNFACPVCCHELFVRESNRRGAVDVVPADIVAVDTTIDTTSVVEEKEQEQDGVWPYE